jgi:Prophage tail length tape measure protein
MAEKELSILVRAKGAAQAARDIGKVDSAVGRIAGHATRGARTAAANIGKIGLIAAGAVAANVAAGIQSLASIEKVQTQTKAVLESTGGAAGQTLADITKRSQDWSAAIGKNEEDVQDLQNLLLTFTGITGDTFDQATTTALDMSQALGQDFKSSAIQLGKALNDPVRGITALRRVGVQFTADQEKQIKALVKSGRTLDAQKMILAELNKEFGGSAAAFGETYEGQFDRFKQAVQGAQRALAVAFLPILVKVGDKLRTWLSDEKTLNAIKKFGGEAADAFDDILTIVENLPWDSIKTAFQVMGAGAKAALNLFTSMPPWVQTAILTGWGLNKLTGGALGGIVGELGKGLIRGVLGINAGVVNVRGGIVNGGPGGAAAGGKGLLGKAATGLGGALGGGAVLGAAALAVSGAIVAGAAIATQKLLVEPGLQARAGKNIEGTNALIASGDAKALRASIDGLKQMPSKLNPLQKVLYELNANGVKTHTEGLIAAMEKAIANGMHSGTKGHAGKQKDDTVVGIKQTKQAIENSKTATSKGLSVIKTAIGHQDPKLDNIQRTTRSSSLTNASIISGAIRANRPNFTTNVVVNVSASGVSKTVTHQDRVGPSTGSAGSGAPSSGIGGH